jgi:hypothetical protein
VGEDQAGTKQGCSSTGSGRRIVAAMSEFLWWQTKWKKVIDAIERDVAELNLSVDEFTVSRFGCVLKSSDEIFLGVQVVSKNGPTETAVVQIAPNTREIQFDGTISKPGVPGRDSSRSTMMAVSCSNSMWWDNRNPRMNP